MPRTYGQHCALARALDRVGERWTLLIVRELLIGPARYTDLRAALPGLATNLLAERLRALEADGIVERRQLPPPAVTTVYALTDLGRGLRDAVDGLIRWGGHWMAARGEGDVFRPEWLVLAVGALTSRDGAAERPLSCRLEVGEHVFTLNVADGVAHVEVGASSPADVALEAEPQALLAVASGRRDLCDAIAAGEIAADGDADAVEALGRLWAGGVTYSSAPPS